MKTMNNDDKLYNAYANFLLCWVPLFEANEALKGTNMYQRDIKKAGNDLERALDKRFLAERYSCLHESDPVAAVHMRDALHDFYKRISTMEPEDWQIMHECVRQIGENKEWVMDRLSITSGTSAEMDDMRERDALIQKIKHSPIAAIRYARKSIEAAENIFK